MLVEKEEKFNFVIGRLWNNGESNLCVYTYFGEVHYGTLEDARNFRDTINNRTDDHKGEYKIYKVSSTPIE